jgi:hypothetical protein
MKPAAHSLATVLFTDIVGSTERAAALRDTGWRELREKQPQMTRAPISALITSRLTDSRMTCSAATGAIHVLRDSPHGLAYHVEGAAAPSGPFAR